MKPSEPFALPLNIAAVNMPYHQEDLVYSVLLQIFGTTKFRSICFHADEFRKVMLATRKLDGISWKG